MDRQDLTVFFTYFPLYRSGLRVNDVIYPQSLISKGVMPDVAHNVLDTLEQEGLLEKREGWHLTDKGYKLYCELKDK